MAVVVPIQRKRALLAGQRGPLHRDGVGGGQNGRQRPVLAKPLTRESRDHSLSTWQRSGGSGPVTWPQPPGKFQLEG